LNLPKENVLYLNTPPPEGNLTSPFPKLELRTEVGLGKPRTTYNIKFRNTTSKKPQPSCNKNSLSLIDIFSNIAVGMANAKFTIMS
jgi:hypothetical protein